MRQLIETLIIVNLPHNRQRFEAKTDRTNGAESGTRHRRPIPDLSPLRLKSIVNRATLRWPFAFAPLAGAPCAA